MKIISRNAEQKLVQAMEALASETNAWRAIHIDFSFDRSLDEQKGGREQLLCNLLLDAFEALEGAVFLCEDRDIIILNKGGKQSLLDELGQYIAQAAGSDGEKEHYRIYDLSVHYEVFSALCKNKCTVMEFKRQREMDALAEAEKHHLTFSPEDKRILDHNLAKRTEQNECRVLIIEDDNFTCELIRRTVENVLRTEGVGAFHIITCSTAQEGL